MKQERLPLFDSLRGVAMVLMATYHFCFDLSYFGILNEDFNNSQSWLWFRALIMTLFTGLVGVGFYLGNASFSSPSYRRRLFKILFSAALITVVTYFLFPQSWIFWGILHYVFFASLLGPLLKRVPRLSLIVGLILIAIPMFYRHIYFLRPGLMITGLSPIKPRTEDFSPLMPWLGVTMVGIFVGYLARKIKGTVWSCQYPPLSRLGHYSLEFYMVHQLVLFPLAWLLSKIF